MVMRDRPIVFFDGVCNYCNAMVKFAIRNDKKARLTFSPLQSADAAITREYYKIPPEIDTVLFLEKNKVNFYSDAALLICKYLDWPAKGLYGLLIIPKFIRDPIYRWIARHRYKWFGKKETCMVPTPDIVKRFL